MKKLLAVLAFSIAIPSVAHAADTPQVKEDCCAKMKAEGKKCCCDEKGKDAHAEHDMTDMNHSGS